MRIQLTSWDITGDDQVDWRPNQIVDVIDADNATGNSYAMVFRQEDPVEGQPSANVAPRAVVEYRDKFRRTAEGWRIAERQYQYNFLQAE